MQIKQFILAILVILGVTTLYAEPKKMGDIHMFPEAKEGYERFVLKVPKSENDYDRRIELLIGKEMMVDCNHHSFSAEIKRVILKGWGYSYLEVDDIQSGPTTLMACHEPEKLEYIYIRDELRRYNSRMPMVIYVPKGYEVRYRIWSADQRVQKADQR